MSFTVPLSLQIHRAHPKQRRVGQIVASSPVKLVVP